MAAPTPAEKNATKCGVLAERMRTVEVKGLGAHAPSRAAKEIAPRIAALPGMVELQFTLLAY